MNQAQSQLDYLKKRLTAKAPHLHRANFVEANFPLSPYPNLNTIDIQSEWTKGDGLLVVCNAQGAFVMKKRVLRTLPQVNKNILRHIEGFYLPIEEAHTHFEFMPVGEVRSFL